jgi:glycosyltransferase involved in cell wall biosynthesis
MTEKNAKTVTVVIPTFNRSAELARALDSLTQQTDPDFAVFVCDDGSAENIQEVVDRFADKLDIECERIPNSGGPARPRNIGTARARGEWVSFLDSDDWWKPTRMAAIKRHLDDDVDVVYHRLQITHAPKSGASTPADEPLGLPIRYDDALVHMLRFGNPLPTSATTVRVALMREIEGFDDRRELASVEDFDAWLRLAARGARFRFVPETLGYYWVGDDNISAFTPRQYERQRALFERQLDLLPAAYRRRASSNFNYLLGSYELMLGLPDSGRLRAVELTVEPARWLKARVKTLQRALTRSTRSA